MAVKELALLRLKPTITITTPSLISALHTAKETMQSFSGRQFYYLHEPDYPHHVYILGEWDSLSHHLDEFIPSEGNQAVLRLVKDLVDVEWLVHFDIGESRVPVEAPVIEILRCSMVDEKASAFEGCRAEHKIDFNSNAKYGAVVSGWRVDVDEGKKEFVVFSGWDDKEEYSKLAKLKGWDDERNNVQNLVDSYSATNVRILDI